VAADFAVHQHLPGAPSPAAGGRAAGSRGKHRRLVGCPDPEGLLVHGELLAALNGIALV